MMEISIRPAAIPAPPFFEDRRVVRHLLAVWGRFRSSVFASAEIGSRAFQPDAAAAARFQQTILPHLDAAHNLARYLSRDADAAQDIVQEAFLRAFRSFGDFRGGSPRAWILTIVRNCHNNWRSERKHSPLAANDERRPARCGEAEGDIDTIDLDDIARDEDTPETNLLRRERSKTVQAVLESMPELLREVLVLRELEDMSYREIADVTSIPIGTVMSRLARARGMFEMIWQRRVMTSENAP
jgi:RNA polymerase sigma-70 factor (ECF subfamily)